MKKIKCASNSLTYIIALILLTCHFSFMTRSITDIHFSISNTHLIVMLIELIIIVLLSIVIIRSLSIKHLLRNKSLEQISLRLTNVSETGVYVNHIPQYKLEFEDNQYQQYYIKYCTRYIPYELGDFEDVCQLSRFKCSKYNTNIYCEENDISRFINQLVSKLRNISQENDQEYRESLKVQNRLINRAKLKSSRRR